MLVGSELKGELARIHPARACCRRAELAGLTHANAEAGRRSRASGSEVELRTLDPATARTAVHLAAALGAARDADDLAGARTAPRRGSGGRQRLRVVVDRSVVDAWSWAAAPACDRRAFLRGVLLASGSISVSPSGLHVEFVFGAAGRARAFRGVLAESGVRASVLERRGRWVVYIKGRDEVATLLRLTGGNRGLLDLETSSVGREVRNRLNRLVNAEEANLARTVAAAERQLDAIAALAASGRLATLPDPLRETVAARRRLPEADLDELSRSLGVTRSAVNHRLRRVVALAHDAGDDQQRRRARRARSATSPRRMNAKTARRG